MTPLAPLADATPLVADAAALREAAARDGYLYLPRLVDGASIDALREAVLGVCDELGLLAPGWSAHAFRARPGARLEPFRSPEWIELQRRVAHLDAFSALARHPAITRALTTLFGAPPVPHRGDVCRVLLPGAPEHTIPPHQDYCFLRRNGLERQHEIWSAWLPLHDCPPELGGIAVVPGSHRRGLLPHEPLDARGEQIALALEGWAASPLRRGDVVLMSCLTVHRGLENRTPDRVRLSADFRHQPGVAPPPLDAPPPWKA